MKLVTYIISRVALFCALVSFCLVMQTLVLVLTWLLIGSFFDMSFGSWMTEPGAIFFRVVTAIAFFVFSGIAVDTYHSK